MKKVLGTIDKKTGKLTFKVEGCAGVECTMLTAPLEIGLGMREPERELLPEFYQTTEQQTQQQGTQ